MKQAQKTGYISRFFYIENKLMHGLPDYRVFKKPV